MIAVGRFLKDGLLHAKAIACYHRWQFFTAYVPHGAVAAQFRTCTRRGGYGLRRWF